MKEEARKAQIAHEEALRIAQSRKVNKKSLQILQEREARLEAERLQANNQLLAHHIEEDGDGTSRL